MVSTNPSEDEAAADKSSRVNRRRILKRGGALTIASLVAGCTGGNDGSDGNSGDGSDGNSGSGNSGGGGETGKNTTGSGMETFKNEAGKEVGATFDAVKELAKEEEGVTLYATIDKGPMKVLMDEFHKKYPDVGVTHITGGSEDLRSRWDSEYRSGNVNAGISISNRNAAIISSGQNMKLSGDFMPSYEALPDKFKGSDGNWIGVRMRLGNIFYNTDEVSEDDVNTWMDIATNDRWSGQKIGWDPTPNMDLMWWLLDTQGREFFENLRDQRPRFVDSHSDLARFTGAGEFPVAFTYTHKMGEYGEELPVDYFKFDPTPGVVDPLVINNKAPSPNSAILFTNWLTSAAGQKKLGTTQYIPAHPEAEYKGYPNLYPSDAYEVDTFISKPENREKASKMWQEVMSDFLG